MTRPGGGIVLLEHYGVMIGLGLLATVSLCAWLLARQAARHITEFREERHERFRGRPPS